MTAVETGAGGVRAGQTRDPELPMVNVDDHPSSRG